MDERWARRSRSFGAIAELYDLRRPGYPDTLFDTVLNLASGRRVLDVGAGTGRASLALARRGASVLAVEPDAAMAEVLCRRAPTVQVQVAAFEDCDVPPATFDLVVAAQSWHWVDHDRGARVAADALCEGGHLCLWWNRPNVLVGPVWNAMEAVYRYLAPELRPVVLGHPAQVAGDDVPPAPGFGPWSYAHWDWTQNYAAAEFAELLDTHSDHAVLPPIQRELLLEAVARTVDDVGGGAVTYPYRTFLAYARRR
ncbi:MAG: class I SAM-dependent methyltransferase [Sporichthyaceae bacterium]